MREYIHIYLHNVFMCVYIYIMSINIYIYIKCIYIYIYITQPALWHSTQTQLEGTGTQPTFTQKLLLLISLWVWRCSISSDLPEELSTCSNQFRFRNPTRKFKNDGLVQKWNWSALPGYPKTLGEDRFCDGDPPRSHGSVAPGHKEHNLSTYIYAVYNVDIHDHSSKYQWEFQDPKMEIR